MNGRFLLFGVLCCLLGCSSSRTPSSTVQSINVFFANLERERNDPTAQGRDWAFAPVYPVPRQIKSDNLEEAALRELLKGPTPAERSEGYSTYCSGLRLSSFHVLADTAEVALEGTPNLQGLLAGPRMRAQIRSTVLQFGSFEGLRIRVDGREDFDSLR